MKSTKQLVFGLLIVPLLLGLACQLGSVAPSLPDVDINTAATQAADVAATAQAAVANMDGLSATAAAVAATAESAAAAAAAQGEQALATVQAATTLVPPVTVDVNALQERIAAIQPDESGNVTVTITDDELNQAITVKQQAEGGQNALQNTAVTFTSGGIILTGSVTTPVAAQLTVVFNPYVTNGSLQFDVVSATVGTINVPPSLLDSAEATLNATLGEALSQLPTGVTLSSVTVGDGLLTVTGSRS